jgi:hypothetical protein
MKSRLITLVLFAVFALLELGDAFGILQTLAAPEPVAAMLNISVAEEVTRATILLALAMTIALASAVTVLGAWRRSKLVHAWVVVAAGYVVYGVYQIGSALLQSKAPALAASGVVFLLLGAAAYSFGRSASHFNSLSTASPRR